MEHKTIANAAPPPPSEVKIRTMRSDLASMRASGGGAPKFQNVAVAGLSLEKGYHAAETNQSPVVAAPQSVYQPPEIPVTHEVGSAEDVQSHILPVAIVIIVAIVALAAVGYVAYITFAK